MRTRLFLLGLFLCLPLAGSAATVKTTSFEVSGWIPYWREDEGTKEVTPRLSALTAINPFGYTVNTEGVVNDAMGVADEPWKSFIASAKTAKVRVIPSIMWHDGTAIHTVLSNKESRTAHIANIVSIVEIEGFDGIDIDYEAKRAETNPYFSLFLKELYAAMGKHWVYCTIEPRTPPEAAFTTVPSNLQYANNYADISKYCDRVIIMAYDQGTIDLTLNAAAQSTPYVPVADPLWVEKVMKLAAKTIPKKKLIIGIPTYGYEYAVTPLAEGYRYDRQWAFNPQYALDLALQRDLTPSRNRAGEMSFAYIATTSPIFTGAGVAAGPSFAANTASFNLLWWSDAVSVAQKIGLAKKLGVRGVAIFKLDGSHDPKLWNVLLGN